MPALAQLQCLIDRFITATGRALAWLIVAMVLLTCLVVALRYGFHINSVPLQESVMYLHAAVFMLGAAYTLQRDGHVRVDILYRRFSPRGQAWVDALGILVFLLPLCVYLIGASGDFVLASWRIGETSADNGIAAVYFLKALPAAMAVLLTLQGLALLIRNLLVLIGAAPAVHLSARNPQ